MVRTRVTRVTGGYTNLYTTEELRKMRDRQGSNLRGQGPLDFKSSPVTTWVRSHRVSGLVVEWLPATESARVRFPAFEVFPRE